VVIQLASPSRADHESCLNATWRTLAHDSANAGNHVGVRLPLCVASPGHDAWSPVLVTTGDHLPEVGHHGAWQADCRKDHFGLSGMENMVERMMSSGEGNGSRPPRHSCGCWRREISTAWRRRNCHSREGLRSRPTSCPHHLGCSSLPPQLRRRPGRHHNGHGISIVRLFCLFNYYKSHTENSDCNSNGKKL